MLGIWSKNWKERETGRDGVSLCFVLGTKLLAAGRQAVVNSADCQGCDAVGCRPVFVVDLLFMKDNKLAKGRGRCCWNYTAGVDEGEKGREQ